MAPLEISCAPQALLCHRPVSIVFLCQMLSFILSREHIKELVGIIKKQMNIVDYSDWYRVSHSALAKEIGHGLLRRSGGLYGKSSLLFLLNLINIIELLIRAYPNHNWDRERFMNIQKRALQKLLKEIVTQIFTGNGKQFVQIVDLDLSYFSV